MAQFVVPPIKGYVQGDFGKTIRLTAKDLSGNTQDLSSFDGTNTLYARHEDTGKEVSATISFASDGTDGQFEWTFASGDIDKAGDWTVQAEFKDSGGSTTAYSLPQNMPVSKKIQG